MRALGKRSASAVDRLHFLSPGQHAAFQLEIVEAVARMGGFGQPHDGVGRQRFLVAQPDPVIAGFWTPR